MSKPKSKLQSWQSPAAAPSHALDLDELTQQVETPLAADHAFVDEPTLVGLDFDEALTQRK